ADPPRPRQRPPPRGPQPVRRPGRRAHRGPPGRQPGRGVPGRGTDAVGHALRPQVPRSDRGPPRPHRGHRARPVPPAGDTTAAEALAACRRPLIIAGAGAHGAGQEIETLAATLGAGVIVSSNAKGVIDDDGEHSLGAIGFLELLPELTADADALVAIGTELAS